MKLSREEDKQRDRIAAELGEAVAAVESAVAEYNGMLATIREPVAAALATLNAKLEEARGFASGIVDEAREEFDGKSERWQESDKGQAVSSWLDQWDEAASALDDVEIEFPDDIEFDEPGAASTLLELPREPEE